MQNIRIAHMLAFGVFGAAGCLLGQAESIESRDLTEVPIPEKVTAVAMPLRAELILLPAGDPIATTVIDASSIDSTSLRVSYSTTPVFYSVEDAAALMQGRGMAITFVWQEDEERFYVAAFDASVGEAGDWLYATIPDYRSQVAGISLELKDGLYSVWVEGVLLLQDLTPAESLSSDFVFYGDEAKDIAVEALSINTLDEVEPAERLRESINERFNRAQRFGDVTLSDGGKLTRRGGLLTRKGDAFRAKMASLPPELKDVDLSKVIFVDNEIGDDRNSGRWPEEQGRNGPKESLKAAIEAVPVGGIVVLMPGFGVYIESGIRVPKKKCALVIVGDNIVGSENDLNRAYENAEMARPQDFLSKFQKAKHKNNQD